LVRAALLHICVAVVCVRCVRVFFFFQAEDGIRDWSVTGVQTCALPILDRFVAGVAAGDEAVHLARDRGQDGERRVAALGLLEHRSEERRVGKECRSRGSPYHYKKKRRGGEVKGGAGAGGARRVKEQRGG